MGGQTLRLILLIPILLVFLILSGCVANHMKCTHQLPLDVQPDKNAEMVQLKGGREAEYFGYYRCLAGLGHEESQYRLGLAYEKGIGVEVDLKKASRWYDKAADAKSGLQYTGGTAIAINTGPQTYGHKEAQYRLGMFYLEGRQKKQDNDYARLWFSRAAAQGHKKAEVEIMKLDETMKKIGK